MNADCGIRERDAGHLITEAVYQFVQLHYIELLSVLPVTFLLTGLVFCVWFDRYLREWNKRRMMLICILVFSLIVQNYLDYLLTVGRPMIMVRRMVDIYGYSVRPVILLLFLYIVYPGGRYRPVWILAGVNALIYLTGLFSDICFTIDAENRFRGGMPVLRNSCLILSLFLLGLLLYLVLRHFRPLHLQEALIPFFVTFLILLALLLDSSVLNVLQPVSFLTIAIVISCVLFYNWLHSRFVEEYEQAIATQQRIQIMMTQIQPHFLYNTLATIRSLCQRSPETAARLIERFSRYLRQNLDAPNLPDLIPFRQELEHAQIYLEIETMMFPYIRVQYEIDDDQFLLPVLTLQPLVENAVRHGVRGRESGEILISTRKEADHHTIVIRDNGKGFVPDAVSGSDGTHIGIRNVRERLDKLCGGTLQIESTPGEGTTVTMIVPASRREDPSAGTRVGRNHT